MDIFQCALVLFMMVMKSQPFNSTHYEDPYYKKLCNNKTNFWKIFASNCEPSLEFKDLIEKMLQDDPKKRLSLEEIK